MNSLALIIEARFIGYGKNSILAGNTKFRWPLEGGVGVRSPRGGGGRGGRGEGGKGRHFRNGASYMCMASSIIF